MTIDEERDNDRDNDQLILRLAPPDRWAALSRRPYSSAGLALSVDEYGDEYGPRLCSSIGRARLPPSRPASRPGVNLAGLTR